MLGWHTLVAFSAASLLLALIPGPDLLYIASRSLAQGRKAGVVSVLGIYTGVSVHIAAAALGLSAVLASSVIAFDVVRYLGAAYLIVLGLTMLLSRQGAPRPGASISLLSLKRVYLQGVFTNLLNPKVALFFLAFLPQFVHPSMGHITGQTLLLGLVFTLSAIGIDFAAALLVGVSGEWLRRRGGGLGLGLRWLSGSILLGLGVGTLVAGQKTV